MTAGTWTKQRGETCIPGRAFVAWAGLFVCLMSTDSSAVAQRDALSEYPRVRLVFLEAPEAYACPSPDWLVLATEANLGRSLEPSRDENQRDSELPYDLTIAVGFARIEHGLTAHIEMFDREQVSLGTRDVETTETSCATLSEGLPLVLALLVDMHETEARVRLTPHRPPIPEETWDFTLTVGASFDGGWLPEPAFGSSLSFEFGPLPAFRVVLRTNVVLPQRSMSDGVGASVWGLVGALGVCSALAVGPFELGGCLLMEGGWLEPAGIGLARNRVGSAAHLALEPLLRGTLVALEPFITTLEIGVGIPIAPQRFVYDDRELEREFFVSSPASFRAGVRVGTRWH